MKNKLALMVALVLGLVSMAAIYLFIDKNKQRTSSGTSVEVAVARTEIAKNMPMKSDLYKWYKLPKSIYDRMSSNLITKSEIQEYLDSSFKKEVEKDRFILKNYFPSGQYSKKVSLKKQIPSGKVAVSIGIEGVAGMSNLLRPGDYVDILTTYSIPLKGIGAYNTTFTLFPKQPILALDRFVRGSGRAGISYSSVTFALYPQQATLLIHASKFSSIYLTLNSKKNSNHKLADPVDKYNIIENQNLRVKDHPSIQNWLQKNW